MFERVFLKQIKQFCEDQFSHNILFVKKLNGFVKKNFFLTLQFTYNVRIIS